MTHETHHSSMDIMWQLILLILLVGYALPWVSSTSTSLTANGYDLAEWMSLHPTVRATSAVLLPALMLRSPLLLLGLIFADAVARGWWWFILPIMAIWLGMIPPVAFFQGDFGDANYQQQALLWFTYTVSIGLGLKWPIHRSGWLLTGVGIIGCLVSVFGCIIALDLLGRYDISVTPGSGYYIFIGSWGAIAAWGLVGQLKQRESR